MPEDIFGLAKDFFNTLAICFREVKFFLCIVMI